MSENIMHTFFNYHLLIYRNIDALVKKENKVDLLTCF